ncbi:GntR family transcriptional regulator [Streptomyces sp. NPDC046821]|uniref:GntR family transcriptional regulator n=1 Tax=Streptomyces sp. NPDC046821 TaxID=3154702 RepID=UPI0033C65462
MTTDTDLPLGEAAYRTIREAILTCRLMPGARITERGLAAEMNLGISPVRNAMTRLDHEGLIQTIPRKGYQVAPMTVRSVNELFQYWAMFGSAMAEVGLAKANDQQIAELIEVVQRLASVTSEPEDSHETALRVIDDAIAPFDVLAEFIDNQYFLAEYRRLYDELRRVWIMVVESELLVAGRRMDDYDECISAIRQRDISRFVAFLRNHIEQSHMRVASSLTRFPSLLDAEIVPVSGEASARGRKG